MRRMRNMCDVEGKGIDWVILGNWMAFTGHWIHHVNQKVLTLIFSSNIRNTWRSFRGAFIINECLLCSPKEKSQFHLSFLLEYKLHKKVQKWMQKEVFFSNAFDKVPQGFLANYFCCSHYAFDGCLLQIFFNLLFSHYLFDWLERKKSSLQLLLHSSGRKLRRGEVYYVCFKASRRIPIDSPKIIFHFFPQWILLTCDTTEQFLRV